MDKLLFKDNDWTVDDLEKAWSVIDRIGKEKYNLDYYEPRLEIVTFEHMLDVYASNGLPNLYKHWSFGKTFLTHLDSYAQGYSGLAYEVVINTNPLITYLMENNTATMQALVMAHAVCGHGSFFKGNYMFKENTNPNTILSRLLHIKNYIQQCEDCHGADKVEEIIDACHHLSFYSVDKYPRKKKSKKEILEQMKKRSKHADKEIDLTLESARNLSSKKDNKAQRSYQKHENILRYIEQHGPKLKKWEKKILRYYREIYQYLYPQVHTQIMNEGWASFWHYTIMNDLYDEGYINDASILEFLHSHSSVLYQPPFNSMRYSGINPYALGFHIFMDIKRMCENPTEEDREFAPDICGTDWLTTMKNVMENYKDDSFILQFLSPKVLRDFKFFSILEEERHHELVIEDVHDNEGLAKLRKVISEQASLSYKLPDVYVIGRDRYGKRELVLQHKEHTAEELASRPSIKVLKHIQRLWRYPVHLELIAKTGDERRPYETVEIT